jgi:hypothetical protein
MKYLEIKMKMTQKIIELKIDIVLKQYELGNLTVYSPILKEITNNFFSNEQKLQEESLKRFSSLLLNLRAWEDTYFDIAFDNGDKYKDRFVDNFNNFSEFYDFLQGLVKDVEEYHQQRLNNQ